MLLQRANLSTAACTAGTGFALVLPFAFFRLPVTGEGVLAVTLLAAPFISFTAGTVVLASQRSAGFLLVLLLLLAFIPWFFSLFIMAWFQPGLFGAAVLGALMGLAATVLIWLVHLITRSKPAQSNVQSGA